MKDLHDASPENRDFLRARFDAENAGGEALEKYRRKIVEQFFPQRGFGKLKLAEARKAIRDYRKATGNVAGTVDLLLTYVENGTEFTQQFGDINEAYYNSLESALNELATLLRGEGREDVCELSRPARACVTVVDDQYAVAVAAGNNVRLMLGLMPVVVVAVASA